MNTNLADLRPHVNQADTGLALGTESRLSTPHSHTGLLGKAASECTYAR